MALSNDDIVHIGALIQLASHAKAIPANELATKLMEEADRYFDEHVRETLIKKVNIVPFAKEVAVDEN